MVIKEITKLLVSIIILAIVLIIVTILIDLHVSIVLSILSIIIILFCGILYFFRDPVRIPPVGNDLILSPADGKVIFLGQQYENIYLKENTYKISIFMSFFNVHVNRLPVSGKIEYRKYRAGKFYPAYKQKSADVNEQNILCINTGSDKVLVKQIAGIITRRIVCWVNEGDRVIAGQKLGLIKFGSRVEVFLPLHTNLTISVNEKVKAGETIIGVLKK